MGSIGGNSDYNRSTYKQKFQAAILFIGTKEARGRVDHWHFPNASDSTIMERSLHLDRSFHHPLTADSFSLNVGTLSCFILVRPRVRAGFLEPVQQRVFDSSMRDNMDRIAASCSRFLLLVDSTTGLVQA